MTAPKLRLSHLFLSHCAKNKEHWSLKPEKILTQIPTGMYKHLTIFLLEISTWNSIRLLSFWSPGPGGIFYYRTLKGKGGHFVHYRSPECLKRIKSRKGFSRGGIWQLCLVNTLCNSSLPNSHLNTWYRFPILSWKSAALEGWPGSSVIYIPR